MENKNIQRYISDKMKINKTIPHCLNSSKISIFIVEKLTFATISSLQILYK
jgi:hypothetical protein